MSVSPFQDVQSQANKNKCPIPRIVESLTDRGDAENVEALAEALALPKEEMYGTTIQSVLNSWGFDVGAEAVQRHRRNACRCGA